MKTITGFYKSRFGKLMIDAAIGLAVGSLIYLWRGNEIAPFLCAAATASTGLLLGERKWLRGAGK